MTRLESLCYAIMAAEGWAPGSHSWRNNNPGNLKGGPGETGKDGDFSVYPFFANGWLDLFADLYRKCSGRTHSGLTPDSTLHELCRVWTGLAEGEPLDRYVNKISEITEVGSKEPISVFLLPLGTD